MQDPYPIPWENKGKCLGQSLWLPPETLDIVSQRGVHRGQDTEGNSYWQKCLEEREVIWVLVLPDSSMLCELGRVN